MIRRIADGVCAALRCRAELEYTKFVPPTINDEELTRRFIETAKGIIGEERVQISPLIMVSEDFSYFQEKVPGVFFFLGCGNSAKGDRSSAPFTPLQRGRRCPQVWRGTAGRFRRRLHSWKERVIERGT